MGSIQSQGSLNEDERVRKVTTRKMAAREKDPMGHCWLWRRKRVIIQNCGQPLEAGKQENGFSSRASRKEDGPDNTMDLAHGSSL